VPGTLTERIISEHLAGESAEELGLRVDQILLEDATGTMAYLQFERLGLNRVRVPTVSYVDHNVLQFDEKNLADHAYLRSWAARYGALYSRPGNGISHYLHLERFTRPGGVLVGADSHTTMAGALGMLAIGAGRDGGRCRHGGPPLCA
jgi:aconitate hydratase